MEYVRNKYKSVMELKYFKKSIYGQAQDVCVPIVYNVFYIRSNYFIYVMFLGHHSPHLPSSLYFISPLALIIHLRHVGKQCIVLMCFIFHIYNRR